MMWCAMESNIDSSPGGNNWTGPNCAPAKLYKKTGLPIHPRNSEKGQAVGWLEATFTFFNLNNYFSWDDLCDIFRCFVFSGGIQIWMNYSFCVNFLHQLLHCQHFGKFSLHDQPFTTADQIQRAIPRQTSWKRCAPGSQPENRWKFRETFFFGSPRCYRFFLLCLNEGLTTNDLSQYGTCGEIHDMYRHCC